MKKQISILLSLLVAFSLFFVSCSENDDDFKKPSDTGGGVTEHNGHAYVDLGLSVKWATCNVGATEPWEYGDYFAWGETEEKEYYGWETYKWCNGDMFSITKYSINSYYDTIDYNMILDPEDDIAHLKWGGDWRMPTVEEQEELRYNCTWEWTSLNGINGYRVTSKTNDNSIFLPAAGYRRREVNSRGNKGEYWSSSLSSDDASHTAFYMYFNDGGYEYWSLDDRYYGRSVRPVCK